MGYTAQQFFPYPDPGQSADVPRDLGALAEFEDTSFYPLTQRRHTPDTAFATLTTRTQWHPGWGAIPFNTLVTTGLAGGDAAAGRVTMPRSGFCLLAVSIVYTMEVDFGGSEESTARVTVEDLLGGGQVSPTPLVALGLPDAQDDVGPKPATPGINALRLVEVPSFGGVFKLFLETPVQNFYQSDRIYLDYVQLQVSSLA